MSDNHTHPHNRRTFFVVQSSTKDCWLTQCDVGQVAAIDVLPDDVLRTIFVFCVVKVIKAEVYVSMYSETIKRKER